MSHGWSPSLSPYSPRCALDSGPRLALRSPRPRSRPTATTVITMLLSRHTLRPSVVRLRLTPTSVPSTTGRTALWRPRAGSVWADTNYDHLVRSVRIASGSGTTRASDGHAANLRVLPGVRCAAKALPSGPKIAAEWGADTYRHGGLMSTIEHINYRHAYGSGFSGVSRYAEGTSVRDIKGYVDYVLRNGTVTDRG